jgi:hypothetical protein
VRGHYFVLREILILLPLDDGPDSAVVQEIARIPNLFLIMISLLQLFILKELVGGEDKRELEPGFWRGISDADVGEMLQSTDVAIDDDLRGTDVVPQRGQPEFRDRSGLRGICRKFFVRWVIFERLFLSSLDLVRCRFRHANDDRGAEFVQWLGQVEVLPKEAKISSNTGVAISNRENRK